MASLDPKVAEVLDKRTEKAAATGTQVEDDEDELFEELERDDALDGFRERRLQELHEEYAICMS